MSVTELEQYRKLTPAECHSHNFRFGYCTRCDLPTEHATIHVAYEIAQGWTGVITALDCVDHDEITLLQTHFYGRLHGEQDTFDDIHREQLQREIDTWRAAKEARAQWMDLFDGTVKAIIEGVRS